MKLTVEKLVEIIQEQLPISGPPTMDSAMAIARSSYVDQDDVDRYRTQRSIAANAEKLKANAYDQDDIDQLRLKASNASLYGAIDFLFGGENNGIFIAHDPSELQPLEQFNNSELFRVIDDLGFEALDGKYIFDAANKLFHKNFVSVVEEMATGFQLSQNSDGSLSLGYKFGDAEKMKRVMTKYIKKAILAAGHNLGLDRSLLARAKSALGLEETKMKFTQEQVLSIIKEEIAAVLSEDAEDSASDLFDAVEKWQNAGYPGESWEGISDLFDTLKDELEFAGEQEDAGALDEYYDNMVALIFTDKTEKERINVEDDEVRATQIKKLHHQVDNLNSLLNDLM